ncbi:MAG: hypothetical protein Q8O37_13860 [Sulfuricellaceae bacterium]|nr:hypothetical protein [Sulfuricellaceae bacterium]
MSFRQSLERALSGPMKYFMRRVMRFLDISTYGFRRKFGRPKMRNKARIGIYVAYYDASWIFEDHLCCIRDKTIGSFNYYVMGNCTTLIEQHVFNEVANRFDFVKVLHPWPRLLPYSHGQSLQRLIDHTTDEIIVLCDVDAFPIKDGWDDFVVKELATKDVVAVVVDMPQRSMPVFLHPCFMAFRRELLVNNRLNVLPENGNDPACMITTYLLDAGRLTLEHVTPLFPSHREIELSAPGTNEFFGRNNLIHGFGTTYADMVFHFWFARHIASKKGVRESETNLSETEVERVVRRVLDRVRQRSSKSL